MFYDRLFALDPAVRPLFKGDMREQGRKLMMMIGTAVAGLSDLPRLVPAVQSLGKRHAGYGVRDAHYDSVGLALLKTLRQGIGVAFRQKCQHPRTAASISGENRWFKER